jgi:hypothetical protein
MKCADLSALMEVEVRWSKCAGRGVWIGLLWFFCVGRGVLIESSESGSVGRSVSSRRYRFRCLGPGASIQACSRPTWRSFTFPHGVDGNGEMDKRDEKDEKSRRIA